MKKCPRCGGQHFTVTAHVAQEWIVDGNGNFYDCIDDCVDITHEPDDDDVWHCAYCGYSDSGAKLDTDSESYNTRMSYELKDSEKVYTKIISVPADVVNQVLRYVSATNSKNYQEESQTIAYTAQFLDGYEVDISVRGVHGRILLLCQLPQREFSQQTIKKEEKAEMRFYRKGELKDKEILNALRQAAVDYENGAVIETRDVLYEIIHAIDEFDNHCNEE